MKTAEEHLENARFKRDQTTKDELRRARIRALLLACATVVSLIFMVYAFIEKAEVDNLRQELLKAKQELENCQRSK